MMDEPIPQDWPSDLDGLNRYLAARFGETDRRGDTVCFSFATFDPNEFYRHTPHPRSKEALECVIAQAIAIYSLGMAGKMIFWDKRPALKDEGDGHWSANARLAFVEETLQ